MFGSIKKMKIALIQQHATRDKADNIKRGLEALENAAANGADLIAFPELALEFFWPQHPATQESLNSAESIPGPTTELFSQKAKELGVVIILNLFEKDNDKTYDTSPVIDANGKIIGKTRMIHILEAPCFHEQGYYTPGDLGAPVFKTKFGRIGVAICYDRHFPEYMRALALKGADLVVVPQAGAVDEWTAGLFEAELQIAAFQNGYYAALVNRVGKEDCVTFAGESYITNAEGEIIARAPKMKDTILYSDIDFTVLKNCPARKHFLLDRRPSIYDNL